MNRLGFLTAILFGLVITLVPTIGLTKDNVCNHIGCTWLATGTITKVNGNTIYLLAKDNIVYTVLLKRTEVIFEDFATDDNSLRVGDTIRVYGTISGPQQIQASRIRVFSRKPSSQTVSEPESDKLIKIIVEPEPIAEAGTKPPATDEQPANWSGRGLVTDIDYAGRMIKMRTSTGQYTINAANARLVHGNKIIGLGTLNQGDAVRITGRLVGLNEIDANEVRVVRTHIEAENALPQKPISVVGIIQQIDYPSFTFTMSTESAPITVLADVDTLVQLQGKKSAFMHLKPGMRVRMSGYGSLATGFAAKEIQIISISP
jgi:hypothetical protein